MKPIIVLLLLIISTLIGVQGDGTGTPPAEVPSFANAGANQPPPRAIQVDLARLNPRNFVIISPGTGEALKYSFIMTPREHCRVTKVHIGPLELWRTVEGEHVISVVISNLKEDTVIISLVTLGDELGIANLALCYRLGPEGPGALTTIKSLSYYGLVSYMRLVNADLVVQVLNMAPRDDVITLEDGETAMKASLDIDDPFDRLYYSNYYKRAGDLEYERWVPPTGEVFWDLEDRSGHLRRYLESYPLTTRGTGGFSEVELLTIRGVKRMARLARTDGTAAYLEMAEGGAGWTASARNIFDSDYLAEGFVPLITGASESSDGVEDIRTFGRNGDSTVDIGFRRIFFDYFSANLVSHRVVRMVPKFKMRARQLGPIEVAVGRGDARVLSIDYSKSHDGAQFLELIVREPRGNVHSLFYQREGAHPGSAWRSVPLPDFYIAIGRTMTADSRLLTTIFANIRNTLVNLNSNDTTTTTTTTTGTSTSTTGTTTTGTSTSTSNGEDVPDGPGADGAHGAGTSAEGDGVGGVRRVERLPDEMRIKLQQVARALVTSTTTASTITGSNTTEGSGECSGEEVPPTNRYSQLVGAVASDEGYGCVRKGSGFLAINPLTAITSTSFLVLLLLTAC